MQNSATWIRSTLGPWWGQGEGKPARRTGMRTGRPELPTAILCTFIKLINFPDLQIPNLSNRKDAICLCTVAVRIQFNHSFTISKILIKHLFSARHFSIFRGQILNNSKNARESQCFLLTTNLDRRDPGHLLKLIVYPFSPSDTLICNFPSVMINR